jgi:hypothetical protein
VTNPSKILGVAPNAGEEELRVAYLHKVKENPPDRAPEEFEKIRDAYETLRDPRKRTRTMLLSTDAGAPLVSLLDAEKPTRLFTGPQLWREVLKAK